MSESTLKKVKAMLKANVKVANLISKKLSKSESSVSLKEVLCYLKGQREREEEEKEEMGWEVSQELSSKTFTKLVGDSLSYLLF